MLQRKFDFTCPSGKNSRSQDSHLPELSLPTSIDETTRKKEKIQLTFCFAICSRRRSSFSRSSGVKFSPKSFNSYTGRISTSDSPGIGFGQRFNHSTASSMDRTCQIQ